VYALITWWITEGLKETLKLSAEGTVDNLFAVTLWRMDMYKQDCPWQQQAKEIITSESSITSTKALQAVDTPVAKSMETWYWRSNCQVGSVVSTWTKT